MNTELRFNFSCSKIRLLFWCVLCQSSPKWSIATSVRGKDLRSAWEMCIFPRKLLSTLMWWSCIETYGETPLFEVVAFILKVNGNQEVNPWEMIPSNLLSATLCIPRTFPAFSLKCPIKAVIFRQHQSGSTVYFKTSFYGFRFFQS